MIIYDRNVFFTGKSIYLVTYLFKKKIDCNGYVVV